MAFKIRPSYLDSVAPSTPSTPKKSAGSGLSKGGKYAALMHTGISTATAFGFGFAEGKGYLPTLVAGQPWLGVDLIAGAAIHAALFFGGAKTAKFAKYAAPIADGALNNWGSYMGLWLAKGGGASKVFNAAGVRGEMEQGAHAPVGAQTYAGQYAPQQF